MEQQKKFTPKKSVWSVILGCFAYVVGIIFNVIVGVLMSDGNAASNNLYSIIVVLTKVVWLLPVIIGFLLGIWGMFEKNTKKGVSVIGIIINVMVMLFILNFILNYEFIYYAE
jgi:hypothetical protein